MQQPYNIEYVLFWKQYIGSLKDWQGAIGWKGKTKQKLLP